MSLVAKFILKRVLSIKIKKPPMDLCWELVEKLMRTAPNKLLFYQKGLRAMQLIQRAL